MRAIYHALDLSFGRLEEDEGTSISFMRQPHRSRRSSDSSEGSDTSIKSKPVAATRALAPSRILRVFHRARRVLSAPARVPMIPTNTVPRRYVIIRP
jgi:hypothetical protein